MAWNCLKFWFHTKAKPKKIICCRWEKTALNAKKSKSVIIAVTLGKNLMWIFLIACWHALNFKSLYCCAFLYCHIVNLCLLISWHCFWPFLTYALRNVKNWTFLFSRSPFVHMCLFFTVFTIWTFLYLFFATHSLPLVIPLSKCIFFCVVPFFLKISFSHSYFLVSHTSWLNLVYLLLRCKK